MAKDGKSEPVNVQGHNMLPTSINLMYTYNRFRNSKESAEDIVRLRELYVKVDRAVENVEGQKSKVKGRKTKGKPESADQMELL